LRRSSKRWRFQLFCDLVKDLPTGKVAGGTPVSAVSKHNHQYDVDGRGRAASVRVRNWVDDCSPEVDLTVFGPITRSSTSRSAVCAAGFLLFGATTRPASAQTLTLTDANATTLRGGTYAGTNYGSQGILETRASDNATYVRRPILKFDTQNTIPAGSVVTSALLTVTVAGGNSESRSIGLYRLSSSYDEASATWNQRKSSTSWASAGGDIAERFAVGSVTNVAGSRVTFDVTSLVQKNVSGAYGSNRYTRAELIDIGASSQSSYKQYYSDEASDATLRPVLTVTLGSSTTTTTTPTGVQLRVLQWNLHHGVGTDGRYDLDRIATWMAKMAPDVITLNEVEKYTSWGNEDQPARYQALLQAKTGKTWYKTFAQEFGAWSSNGKGHLILSRYPFDSTSRVTITQSSGLKGAGAALQAGIVVNGRTINFILSHLDPSDSSMRLIQARDVIRWAASFAENRIVSGDMNAWPDQSSIAEFNKTYYDSWTVAANKGTAYQFAGLSPDGATKNGRIDYIFFSKYASNLVALSSKVYDTRDSSGYMPSDHRPVVTAFEVR
jgi:endonuclease/exonuclease/phosphatase family metal-dependent hydrolase